MYCSCRPCNPSRSTPCLCWSVRKASSSSIPKSKWEYKLVKLRTCNKLKIPQIVFNTIWGIFNFQSFAMHFYMQMFGHSTELVIITLGNVDLFMPSSFFLASTISFHQPHPFLSLQVVFRTTKPGLHRTPVYGRYFSLTRAMIVLYWIVLYLSF